ncbi:unnamed protein product [Ilex paraguariensis]|uniref:Amino acid transporter transmembrane domain-containing protein n=1 Tax=Ilex paraguariensis TaxID=185542 RepID=A0ABC8U5H1_9AQUA
MEEVAEVFAGPPTSTVMGRINHHHHHHQTSAIAKSQKQSLQIITAVQVRPLNGDNNNSTSMHEQRQSYSEGGSEHDREGEGEREEEGEPNPQDAWLPITESRKGNAFTSAFHLLCSGIGIQALVLPVAFVALGWFWGILCLSMAFLWQLYTIWLLVHLHESVPGTRFSRYLHLSIAAFGRKLGKFLGIFPVMYLSGATCAMLIITGGGTMEHFYQVMCGKEGTCSAKTLSGAEWYLVFIFLAIFVALFCPNLNSLVGVSLIGAITAVGYCTIIWVLSISKGKPDGVSYEPSEEAASEMDRIRSILNAIGIIALAFRGHNLVLEIQGTMPSSAIHPSHEPMLRAVTISYLFIPMCLFPLAIGGYWAYDSCWRNLECIFNVSWTQHPEICDRFDLHDNIDQLLMHVPNFCHANLGQLGIHLHQQEKEEVPEMVTLRFSSLLWRIDFLYISGPAFLGKPGSSHWRDHVTSDICLSMFHVDRDQETPQKWYDVVA